MYVCMFVCMYVCMYVCNKTGYDVLTTAIAIFLSINALHTT